MDEVERLIGQLKIGDIQIRRNAAAQLGKIKDKRAVPVLIEILNGILKGDRHYKTLDFNYEFRRSRIMSELSEIFAGPLDILGALGKIGDISAVPALLNALESRDEFFKQKVIEALTEVVEKFENAENLENIENLENFEKVLDDHLSALRKGRLDKNMLITVQIKIAKLIRKIAEKKNELVPKKDLLLDEKPKPPRRGSGIYHTARMIRNG